jgi:chitinase
MQDVSASLSIGGWAGSVYFSSAVATSANRTMFAKAILDVVSTYDLDGIDFECVFTSCIIHLHFLSHARTNLALLDYSWEYPYRTGAGNTLSPSDSANFLLLLQELRSSPAGKALVLSAATAVTPWAGPDGKPLSDVSSFAAYLDYVGTYPSSIPGVRLKRPLMRPR